MVDQAATAPAPEQGTALDADMAMDPRIGLLGLPAVVRFAHCGQAAAVQISGSVAATWLAAYYGAVCAAGAERPPTPSLIRSPRLQSPTPQYTHRHLRTRPAAQPLPVSAALADGISAGTARLAAGSASVEACPPNPHSRGGRRDQTRRLPYVARSDTSDASRLSLAVGTTSGWKRMSRRNLGVAEQSHERQSAAAQNGKWLSS